MERNLVPYRDCGDCTICCIALRIEQPELQKEAGETCRNCVGGVGCSIYATRPTVCRTWFCGWRRFDWVGGALRPDLSHVLVDFVRGQAPMGRAGTRDIGFTILARSGLKAPGLAESIARCIRANHATYLLVPEADGQSSLCLFLNDRLGQAARAQNYAALLWDLDALYASAPVFGDTDDMTDLPPDQAPPGADMPGGPAGHPIL